MALSKEDIFVIETLAVYSALDALLASGLITAEAFNEKYGKLLDEQRVVTCSFRDAQSMLLRQFGGRRVPADFIVDQDNERTIPQCLASYSILEKWLDLGLLTDQQFSTQVSRFHDRQEAAIRLFIERRNALEGASGRGGKVLQHSVHNEEAIIADVIRAMDVRTKTCVDIAAGDGLTGSNTYGLYRNGWSGLAVECDTANFHRLVANYRAFQNVHLSDCRVTPDNVAPLLRANHIPEMFGVLSLDIDGYDFFVLDALLDSFRPCVICAEINEKIPPPIRFSVLYDTQYAWEQNHFFGQSISQLDLLCDRYEYELVWLEYNNALLVPKEINPFEALTPEKAYLDGYLERPDRKSRFPYNADMEQIHSLAPEEALRFLNERFSRYAGKYICTL